MAVWGDTGEILRFYTEKQQEFTALYIIYLRTSIFGLTDQHMLQTMRPYKRMVLGLSLSCAILLLVSLIHDHLMGWPHNSQLSLHSQERQGRGCSINLELKTNLRGILNIAAWIQPFIFVLQFQKSESGLFILNLPSFICLVQYAKSVVLRKELEIFSHLFHIVREETMTPDCDTQFL